MLNWFAFDFFGLFFLFSLFCILDLRCLVEIITFSFDTEGVTTSMLLYKDDHLVI